MNSSSNRFEVDTSSNALARFGFGTWSWRLFTRKANLLLLLFVALIGFVAYLIVLDFINGSCTSDKTPIAVKMLLIFGIYIFISNGIYPHTQWRKVAPDATKFIGHNAVIAQQRGGYYRDTIPSHIGLPTTPNIIDESMISDLTNSRKPPTTGNYVIQHNDIAVNDNVESSTVKSLDENKKINTQAPPQTQPTVPQTQPVLPALDPSIMGLPPNIKRASVQWEY